MALDVSNEDGEISAGTFNPANDRFEVGHGGAENPTSLVYEISVTNQSGDPVNDLVATVAVAPHSGILACRGVLDLGPAVEANPTTGLIVGGDCTSDGLVWQIGTLDGGESAILYFRAEALEDGDDVNRLSVSAEGLGSFILIEEPTLIGGPGTAISLSVADGNIVNDIFSSAVESHFVGDGSASDPDALIYEIAVTNQDAFTATGVELSARIPRSGTGLACREIRSGAPTGGANPNIGSASCTGDVLVWTIGNLDPGVQATLYARIEALSIGNHVSRVTLSADALSNEVHHDELTTVVAVE